MQSAGGSSRAVDQTICENRGHDIVLYEVNFEDVAQVSQIINQEVPRILSTKENPGFEYLNGIRNVNEVYYDTKNEVLRSKGLSLSYRLTEKLPRYNPDREVVTFLDSNLSEPLIFRVKRYKKKEEEFDKHVLLGLIKRKDRAGLIYRLGLSKQLLYQLSPNLHVDNQENVYQITLYNHIVSEVSLIGAQFGSFSVKRSAVFVKFNYYPDSSDYLKIQEQTVLKDMVCSMEKTLTSQVELKPVGENNLYKIYMGRMDQVFPWRPIFRKYPKLFVLSNSLLLALIGFLILYLALNRHSKSISVREILK
jgi:hypothetical protein